jgi:hypothetical protein
VIDWNGTDVAGFAALPPGRYRVELVPEEGHAREPIAR